MMRFRAPFIFSSCPTVMLAGCYFEILQLLSHFSKERYPSKTKFLVLLIGRCPGKNEGLLAFEFVGRR
jgi:hypothetical protein